ncbi:MAG: nucleotidyltransferase domain-containing protein [Nanoarchaeota archaeon]|nr:nucleotidyltransferase domain-containing protein [Nanoarchaeota archaeon]MBU4116271.1 nucleotidyltransferase domain-containing protein [Nanoarchaeota archaeon]
MGNKQTKIISLLKKFKKEIEKKTKVNEMILFGSMAKGLEKENSDVDLIIVSEDFSGQKSFKRSPQFYFMWDSKYDLDVICLTPVELKEKKKQIGIVKEAVREGIKIKN